MDVDIFKIYTLN